MAKSPHLHKSALPNHYDHAAEHYDAFNEARSRVVNRVLERLLKETSHHKILDFACGTGSQVFHMAKKGYSIVGVDINDKMLTVAREKADRSKLDIPLLKGDMRTSQLGTFGVVITIFNAIGHLTQHDFVIALQNIHRQLEPSGFYIFDIFNLEYLLIHNNIKKLTIDWVNTRDAGVCRKIQYSTITDAGLLTSYTIHHEIDFSGHDSTRTEIQTLQVYTEKTLEKLLSQSGFGVVKIVDISGKLFDPKRSQRMLVVAQKNK